MNNNPYFEISLETDTFNIILDGGAQGIKGTKGDKGEKGDRGETGKKGDPGERGAPFTYEDFTEEQLASLKGDKGDKGDTGAQGEQGISITNILIEEVDNG